MNKNPRDKPNDEQALAKPETMLSINNHKQAYDFGIWNP